MNEYLFEDRDPRSLARIAQGAEATCSSSATPTSRGSSEIEGVLFVNDGSVGKPKDGDPRAAWALLTVEPVSRSRSRSAAFPTISPAWPPRSAPPMACRITSPVTSRREAQPEQTEPNPSFTARGKMKRTIESLRVERQYRNVIDTFLAGTLPNFSHERHVDVANILHHLPYGRELMHLGLQTMAHRHGIPEKYRPTSPTVVGPARRHPARSSPLR